MALFRNKYIQFIDTISAMFCRNAEEFKKMLQAKLIILRGIREFEMMYKVAEDKVSSSVNSIHDSLQAIVPPNFSSRW